MCSSRCQSGEEGRYLRAHPFDGLSPAAQRAMANTIGYFLTDAVVMLRCPKAFGWPHMFFQLLLHHAIGVFAFFHATVCH